MAIKMSLEFCLITRHFITRVDGVLLFDDVHLHSWKGIQHDNYFSWKQMALARGCSEHCVWKLLVQRIDRYGLPHFMQELNLAMCQISGMHASFQKPHLKRTCHCTISKRYLMNTENVVLFWKTSIIFLFLPKARMGKNFWMFSGKQ